MKNNRNFKEVLKNKQTFQSLTLKYIAQGTTNELLKSKVTSLFNETRRLENFISGYMADYRDVKGATEIYKAAFHQEAMKVDTLKDQIKTLKQKLLDKLTEE